MSTRRAHQTLPNAEAAGSAVMAWLELLVSRYRDGTPIRPVNGTDDEDARRFSIYVWRERDLIGAALATEVFRGSEWLLTTYDIEASDG